MVAPGVPGQLRDEPVVLMSVIVVVRQDEVGREVRLEILEGFLDQLALERQEAIAKPVDRDLACAGPGQKTSADRRASSTLVGSSPANITHLTSICG